MELQAEERTAASAVQEAKLILQASRNEGRPILPDDEDTKVQDLFKRRDQAKRNIRGIGAKLSAAKLAKARSWKSATRPTTPSGW